MSLQPPAAPSAGSRVLPAGSVKRSTFRLLDPATQMRPSGSTSGAPAVPMSTAILQKWVLASFVAGYSPGAPGNRS